ncbi:MAG: type II toxin-antitoxin system VapC family toxin [Deltaproteobacteria bacterium]|nr:type II toxin-antitoxin system VapC family toxin [Deltaproteobacteria bacterium]
MMPLLFDSFALLRFLQKENGSTRVCDLLKIAAEKQVPCLLNVINFGEILYTTQRRFGPQARMQVFIAVQQMGVIILPCPDSLVYKAAELKAGYAMSYADAFALASAIEHNACLVTGDPEFRQVEHLIKIEWV